MGILFTDDVRPGLSARGLEHYGATEPLLTAQQLANVIRAAERTGYQVTVHAIGDGGIARTLHAMEIALDGAATCSCTTGFSPTASCDASPSSAFRRPSRSRARVASSRPRGYFFPSTSTRSSATPIWSKRGRTSPRVVPAALDPLYRLLILTTGDSPVEHIWADGAPCNAIDLSKRVSVWQALRMMIVETAYLLRIDEHTGTLEPGKWADLIVLSADPLQTPLSGLSNIETVMTVIDGQIVWHNGK